MVDVFKVSSFQDACSECLGGGVPVLVHGCAQKVCMILCFQSEKAFGDKHRLSGFALTLVAAGVEVSQRGTAAYSKWKAGDLILMGSMLQQTIL